MITEKDIYQTYKDYIGLKVHFQNENYNFNPDTSALSKITLASLRKRNDEYFFYRLRSKFRNRYQCIEYLISCYLVNQNFWIGDWEDNKYKTFHAARIKKLGMLEMIIEGDIERMQDYMKDNAIPFSNFFLGDVPPILTERKSIIGDIQDETISFLDLGLRYLGRSHTDDPLWQQRIFVLRRYKYLLPLSREFIVKVFRELKEKSLTYAH